MVSNNTCRENVQLSQVPIYRITVCLFNCFNIDITIDIDINRLETAIKLLDNR